jgi:hypothetical protein
MKAEARESVGRWPDPSEVRAAGLLFSALVLLTTFPLWLHPASTMLPGGPDGELFLWTLSWDAHAFLRQPFAIFDANIYYPLRDTLALSENLIGTAIFSAPVLWLTGNPVLALNIVSLLSTILCGMGAWVLARRLGLGRAAAVVAGLVFAFSPPRFFRMEQMHLGTVHWIPFGLATLHAYLDEGHSRHLKWTAFFFTLQALTSGHGAVFMLIACGGLVVYRVTLGEALRPWRRIRDLGVTGALLLAPVAWLVLPYRRVQEGLGLRRSLENWAVPVTSYFAAPSHVQKWVVAQMPDARVLETAGAFLFPGFLALVLAAAALVVRPARRLPVAAAAAAAAPADSRAAWLTRGAWLLELAAVALVAAATLLSIYRPGRVRVGHLVLFSARSLWRPWIVAIAAVAARVVMARAVPIDASGRIRRCGARALAAWQRWRLALRPSPLGFYGLLTLIAVLLSIGPPLGLWPLVYWMPGFSFIRVPSRFTILGMLGLAVVAGIGFDRVRDRLRPSLRRGAAILVGVLLAAEFLAIPLEVNPYRVDIPAIDRWLTSQPGRFAIAEVPLPDAANPGEFERRQTAYMMHATAHWQKTVHGYSGFRAPVHELIFQDLRAFPTDEGLRRLTLLGVSRIVVHTDLYAPGEWPAVEARIGRFAGWLRLEHVEDAGRVYSLHPPAPQ